MKNMEDQALSNEGLAQVLEHLEHISAEKS